MRPAYSVILVLILICRSLGGQAPPQPLSLDEFLRDVGTLPPPTPEPSRTRGISAASSDKVSPDLQKQLNDAVGLISINIRCSSAAAAARIASVIRAQGELTSMFEDTLWARVRPSVIDSIAGLKEVITVGPQTVDEVVPADAGESIRGTANPGDGVRAAHLDALHKRGFSGKGVKVGILDRGFAGYASLVRKGSVNAAAAQRSFPWDYPFEGNEPHGAASAEILKLGAPAAQIYLASYDGTEGEFKAATEWLIAQGVRIITYAAGNVTRPNDGTDPVSRYINTVSGQGVLWIVAAGNHARQHWSGDSNAARRASILSDSMWPAGQKGLMITAAANRLRIVVRWSEPQAKVPPRDQDIDAYLYSRDTRGQWQVSGRSSRPQSGLSTASMESIELSGDNVVGRQFLLALHAKHLTRNVRIHVFVDPGGAGSVEPAIAEGSILSPAAAFSALSVGAVDVQTSRLAPYSSRGPTDDGRVKPEVTAPANTMSFAYEAMGGRFQGTSASCPHVAAFAALLREANPKLGSAELRTLISRSIASEGRGAPAGMIDATVVPAVTRGAELPEEQWIEVPPEFGHRVSVRTLELLRRRAGSSGGDMSVSIVTERRTYRIGDSLRMQLRASQDCMCLLLVANARREYRTLKPERAGFFALKRNERILFPPEVSRPLTVTEPSGSDELLALCSAQPVDLEKSVSAKLIRRVAIGAFRYQVTGDHP